MLEVIDLSKSYRGIPALRRLNLTVRPGEVIGLLGPNGSGKSTTVKMLVLLVEVFLFLPYVVMRLVAIVQTGAESSLPPVWFLALYFRVAEGTMPFSANAWLAAAALPAAMVAVLLLSLAPAAWMGRRALHIRVRGRTPLEMTAARAIATVCSREPAVRSLYLFAMASLIRNRRHVLVLARYLGMAIAAAVLSILGAALRGTFDMSEPRSYLLAIPLVFVFFAIFGLRTAVAIPVEVEANWPFQMAVPMVGQVLRATRLLILTVGILPIVFVWFAITASVWPIEIAWRVALLDLAAALLVMEVSLLGWNAIPLASPHEPATETLKSRWMGYLAFLLLFAKGGASLQLEAVQSPAVTIVCVSAAVIIVVALRLWRRRQGHRRAPTFESTTGPIQSLNLSEAS
jgi:hypothetical protein